MTTSGSSTTSASDPTELHDLAGERPELVAEMAARWEEVARDNQVYPLDEGSRVRFVTRPPYEEPFKDPVRLLRRTHTLERYRSQLLIQWRSFTVDVELAFRRGDRGVLVAHGDQGGGYSLHVDDGDELIFVHNGFGTMTEMSAGPVPDGARHVRLDVTAPGGWTWDVQVSIDGETRAVVGGLVMLGAMAPFCGIDVGIDRRSPVSWSRYERAGAGRFTGDLTAVTYTPGESAPDAGDRFVDLFATSASASSEGDGHAVPGDDRAGRQDRHRHPCAGRRRRGTRRREATRRRVTLGGHTFRTTVAPMGGRFLVPLSRSTAPAAGVAAGDDVDVEIVHYTSPAVEMPADLAVLRDRPDAPGVFAGSRRVIRRSTSGGSRRPRSRTPVPVGREGRGRPLGGAASALVRRRRPPITSR